MKTLKNLNWYRIFMASMMIATLAIAIWVGVSAVQKSMKMRLSYNITPAVLVKIESNASGSWKTLFNNYGQTEIAIGFKLENGNTLTYDESVGGLGVTSGQFRITNYNTENLLTTIAVDGGSSANYVTSGSGSTTTTTAIANLQTVSFDFQKLAQITVNNNNSTISSTSNNIITYDSKYYAKFGEQISFTFAGATHYQTPTSVTVNSNQQTLSNGILTLTLSADCTINVNSGGAVPYTITYNLNGGSVAGQNPTSYTIETATFTLTNPTLDGYTFAGWTGTGLSSATTSVTIAKGSTGDRNYTANWGYKITYNLGGGTATNPTTYTVETASFTLNNPTRTGYTFKGWTGTDLSSTTTSVTIAKGSTGDRSYTAQWTAITYTIVYHANGGSGTTASSTHTYGTAKTLTINGFSNGLLWFSGWSTSPSATSATYTNAQSVTNLASTQGATVNLYAIWTNENKITFNLTLVYYQSVGVSGVIDGSQSGPREMILTSTSSYSSSNDTVTFTFTTTFSWHSIGAAAGYSRVYDNPQWSSFVGVSQGSLEYDCTIIQKSSMSLTHTQTVTITITLNKVANVTSSLLCCTLDLSVDPNPEE